jgi:hypothetical protein
MATEPSAIDKPNIKVINFFITVSPFDSTILPRLQRIINCGR